ncbi:mucin TcMUCII [Trypanosoma cruzi cruzi]|nr:mucin TcMUCII [Trypanosoma cruzi cruzi]
MHIAVDLNAPFAVHAGSCVWRLLSFFVAMRRREVEGVRSLRLLSCGCGAPRVAGVVGPRSVCVTATGEGNNDNSSPPSPKVRTPDHTKSALGALQPDGGETGGPQRESGRYNEEVLRSQGPSLTTEAGTAITGQTPVPPESLSSANDNPEPRGLATQSPHTHKVRPVCQMHKIKKRRKIHNLMRIIKQRYKNQKIKMSNVTTTTTEVPTTTTTHAPSRLREVDGSLSSSAWVCAPLLLAASALAYTALG